MLLPPACPAAMWQCGSVPPWAEPTAGRAHLPQTCPVTVWQRALLGTASCRRAQQPTIGPNLHCPQLSSLCTRRCYTCSRPTCRQAPCPPPALLLHGSEPPCCHMAVGRANCRAGVRLLQAHLQASAFAPRRPCYYMAVSLPAAIWQWAGPTAGREAAPGPPAGARSCPLPALPPALKLEGDCSAAGGGAGAAWPGLACPAPLSGGCLGPSRAPPSQSPSCRQSPPHCNLPAQTSTPVAWVALPAVAG